MLLLHNPLVGELLCHHDMSLATLCVPHASWFSECSSGTESPFSRPVKSCLLHAKQTVMQPCSNRVLRRFAPWSTLWNRSFHVRWLSKMTARRSLSRPSRATVGSPARLLVEAASSESGPIRLSDSPGVGRSHMVDWLGSKFWPIAIAIEIQVPNALTLVASKLISSWTSGLEWSRSKNIFHMVRPESLI